MRVQWAGSHWRVLASAMVGRLLGPCWGLGPIGGEPAQGRRQGVKVEDALGAAGFDRDDAVVRERAGRGEEAWRLPGVETEVGEVRRCTLAAHSAGQFCGENIGRDDRVGEHGQPMTSGAGRPVPPRDAGVRADAGAPGAARDDRRSVGDDVKRRDQNAGCYLPNADLAVPVAGA